MKRLLLMAVLLVIHHTPTDKAHNLLLNYLNTTPTTYKPAQRIPATTQPAPKLSGDDARCADMETYRKAAGLPARFGDSGRHQRWTPKDGLGWRETKCHNDLPSSTGCCVSYWQLHKIIWTDHRMIAPLARCGATWLNIQGNSVGAKSRAACATKALYDVAGLAPWAPT